MARLPNISKYCTVWRSGACGIVQGIGEAGALDGVLLDAVDHARCGHAGELIHRGCHIDHVRELRADLALGA